MSTKLNIVISLVVGAIVGITATILYNDYQFSSRVKEAVFDECFQYIAKRDADKGGISKASISACVDKANDQFKK